MLPSWGLPWTATTHVITSYSIHYTKLYEALQGRVPGMNITADGNPSGNATVRIRGIGTLNNNDPLYIIDRITSYNVCYTKLLRETLGTVIEIVDIKDVIPISTTEEQGQIKILITEIVCH